MNQKNTSKETIYHYICDYFKENGYAPSIREIGAGVGLKSSATVHHHLKSLEADGLIRRASKKHGYTVLGASFHPQAEDKDIAIPLVGNVAAGIPIMAVENVEDCFPVPSLLLRGAGEGEAFMLHVKGDSMMNAGIEDGDILVVSVTQIVYDGDIVVARIDGAEFTVKRFYHKGNQVELRPENDAYAPLLLSTADVEIAGKVTGLMRSL